MNNGHAERRLRAREDGLAALGSELARLERTQNAKIEQLVAAVGAQAGKPSKQRILHKRKRREL